MTPRTDAHRIALEQLHALAGAHVRLRSAQDIPELFALVAQEAREHLAYRRAIVLALGDATLSATMTTTLADIDGERLRRTLLGRPVPLVRGTREATAARHPDRDPARGGPSRLADVLGLQQWVPVAIAPVQVTLALLVLDRPSPPVSPLDARVAGVCGRLLGPIVELLITRTRTADLVGEVREFSATGRALTGELASAPVSLPATRRVGRTFIDAGATPGALEIRRLLSEQEIRIATLLAEGMSNALIAERLVLATETVKSHVSRILRKLDADNRVQAATRFLALVRGDGLGG
jgi:DNA-binding CsgD family transcriptional regulator